MDVLVHVLALEQHVGSETVDIDLSAHRDQREPSLHFESLPRSASASDFFAKAHSVDWLAQSNAFAELDHQTPIVERALEFVAGDRDLNVQFAPGGQMLDGAIDSALGLFFGHPVDRSLGAGRPVDRSINALRASGWNHGDLRALLHKWAILDPDSAVVLLKFGHDDYEAVHHELVCRYEVVHTEYDFLTSAEAVELSTDGSGSAHTLLIRAEVDQLAPVLERCDEAVFGSQVGEFSVIPLLTLWSPTRTTASSAEHTNRLRKLRRKELVTTLVDRARKR